MKTLDKRYDFKKNEKDYIDKWKKNKTYKFDID